MKEYIENGIRYGEFEDGETIQDGYERFNNLGVWEPAPPDCVNFAGWVWEKERGYMRMRIRLEEPKDEPRCVWCGDKAMPGIYNCRECNKKDAPMCYKCRFKKNLDPYCSEHVHLYRDKDDKPGTEPGPKEPPMPEEKDAGTKALESVLDKVDKMTPEEYSEEYDKIKDMPDAPEVILDYTPQAVIVRGAPPSRMFGSIARYQSTEEEIRAKDKRRMFDKATGEYK